MTVAAGLEIEEIRSIEGLGDLVDDWEHLVAEAPEAELFESPDWILSWLATYWVDRPITFLFVRDHGRLVGLAPLLDDEHGEIGCPGSLVTPVNPHARRCSIVHDGRAVQILDAIGAHLDTGRRGARLRVRCGDAASSVTDAVAHRPGPSLIREVEGSPLIKMGGTWDEYLAALPGRSRRDLGRKRRKLEAAWDVTWTTAVDPDAHERAMTDVLRIERSSWKEREGTSIGSEPEAAPFYSRLGRACARRGRLRIEVLSLDGRPVAHIWGVVFKGTYSALKTSYDEAYRAWSPGVVLFQYVIERSFDEGLDTFDFLGRPDRWKDDLATEVRCHVDACVFAPGALRCRWCAMRRTRIKPLVEARAPVLLDLKQALGGRIGALRGR